MAEEECCMEGHVGHLIRIDRCLHKVFLNNSRFKKECLNESTYLSIIIACICICYGNQFS